MDWLFVGITAVVAMLALGNWRAALYACVLLDVLRDPARKLTEQQSSITTVVLGLVWLAALAGAMNQNRRELLLLVRRYPQLRTSLMCLAIALAPGMLVSMVNYNNGWILAAIGIASYSAPFIGVGLGYLWPRRVDDVYRWMKLYTVVNAVFLVGSLMEAMGWDVPGLGGLKMKWIRNYGADIINLICGFYRSPDVMGLHAAHVMMFGGMIALRPQQRHKWAWWCIVAWASIALILCGRRKMIVIPLLFVVTYVVLFAVFNGRRRLAISFSLVAGVSLVGTYFIADEFVAENEYARFASTIASEGLERASRSFTEIIFTTVNQSGWLGDGLGTVTQGRQYLGVVTQGKDWQEDGVGRLFKELGVPGVIGMLMSGVMLLAAIRSSFFAIPAGHPVSSLQYSFASVVAANLASFSVSHQAYSGDPSTVLIVGFCIGIILGLPRPVWSDIARRQEQQAELERQALLIGEQAPELVGATP